MIYLVIIILLLIMSFQYDYLQKKAGREICFWLIYVLLVGVAALRFRLGQDTTVYMRIFENLHPITQLTNYDLQNSRFAPGFIIVISFFRLFGPDFVNFQIFHSLLINTVFLLFLKKNTRHLFFAIFLYSVFLYFLLCFQQIRESMAAAIFIMALPALVRKRWLIWYGAAFLAITFHVSSIFMFILPLIFVPGIRKLFTFNKFTPFICLIIIALGFVIQSVFFQYIQLIAVTDAMMERAMTYSKSDLSAAQFNLIGLMGRATQWIVYPLVALIFLYGKKFCGQTDMSSKSSIIESMAVLSVYVSSLCISIPIVGRYNNYFYIFSILVMSDWIYTYIYFLGKKVRLQYLTWLLIFMPMIGFQMQNTYLQPVNKSGTLKGYMVYYPYNSYLDKEHNEDREKAMRYIIRKVK